MKTLFLGSLSLLTGAGLQALYQKFCSCDKKDCLLFMGLAALMALYLFVVLTS